MGPQLLLTASRDEFPKPVDRVPEETEPNQRPIETYVEDLARINYGLSEAEFYHDPGMAVTLLIELRTRT